EHRCQRCSRELDLGTADRARRAFERLRPTALPFGWAEYGRQFAVRERDREICRLAAHGLGRAPLFPPIRAGVERAAVDDLEPQLLDLEARADLAVRTRLIDRP